jgi:hypothetical protein
MPGDSLRCRIEGYNLEVFIYSENSVRDALQDGEEFITGESVVRPSHSNRSIGLTPRMSFGSEIA